MQAGSVQGAGSPGGAPRRTTAERREELHAVLLAAAEHIIETDGVAAVRARSLAAAANCSVGAIYNIVPDLDTLILEANALTLAAIDTALRTVSSEAGSQSSPIRVLDRLAIAYLDYAAAHSQRWSALFAHRMAGGAPVPPWYRTLQATMFGHVEAPLATLRPDLPADERGRIARTLFSAVHGIVSLGLSGTLVSLPLEVQRAQLRVMVAAMARGLTTAEA